MEPRLFLKLHRVQHFEFCKFGLGALKRNAQKLSETGTRSLRKQTGLFVEVDVPGSSFELYSKRQTVR